jgi:hypothetical protein
LETFVSTDTITCKGTFKCILESREGEMVWPCGQLIFLFLLFCGFWESRQKDKLWRNIDRNQFLLP